jgi:lipopolysaccharide export LptBFGC system permease protein LptF
MNRINKVLLAMIGLSVIVMGALIVFYLVMYPQTQEFSAEIYLADDASTPEKKSEYLGLFLDKAKSAKLSSNSRVFFKTSRNKTANHIAVLESLKKRCDDLSPLDKSSMGYAQGMTQITGQEFDHMMQTTAHELEQAYKIGEFGWLSVFVLELSLLFFVIFLICLFGFFFRLTTFE